jgi:hypothetical protein
MEADKLKAVIDRINMLHTELGDDWISTRHGDAKAPNQVAVDNTFEILEREQEKYIKITVGPIPCGGFGMSCYTESGDCYSWACSKDVDSKFQSKKVQVEYA